VRGSTCRRTICVCDRNGNQRRRRLVDTATV